ncbi:MAG TPA: cation diffusion facilitator family transporter [Acidimicrobiia bacterium]|nr:cation diffusion facilitator family transporter [Acidimicrobiia bacterium]
MSISASARPSTTAHLSRLRWVFGMVVATMVAELVIGFLTNSLALLSDAGHMATDALGLGMALAAMTVADRVSAGSHRTYGLYRLEILAALANAVLLLGVAGYVLWEAWDRLGEATTISTGPMLAAATVGLVVNIVSWRLLREGAKESLNLQGALLEVLADLWGSVGVVVAGVVIHFTGWTVVDSVVAGAIGLFILPRALRLGAQAVRILVQAAPRHIDLEQLDADLRALPGVVDVHDLHVWTLTSSMDVASVHLMIPEESSVHPVLDQARTVMRDDYGIAHATLQVEPVSHVGCREISW